MTLITLINIGLVLDIIGTLVIFKYGLPSSETKSIHALSFEDPSPEEKRAIKITKRISPIGIILLVCGFVFQLVGNILC